MPGSKWYINLTKDAQKSLLKIPENKRFKINEAIAEMEFGPFVGDVKKFKGHKNLYRKRVGDYRLIFSIMFDILYIEIVEVVNRKDAYKDL